MLRKTGLFPALLCISAFLFCQPSQPKTTNAPVSLSDATVNWKYWNYQVNDDNSLKPLSAKRTKVAVVFPVKILENDFVKVTLLPQFGGRILSILYKPTGHEMLYQNPVGTPYGKDGGSFYYDWLMVYGGIFPTFPEPEHGKTWLLPWSFEIITQTSDQISVRMTCTDTVDFARHPAKFNSGITGLTCEATITVYRDSAGVEMAVRLINPNDRAVSYEYWTCTTLAPGSVPGNSRTTANATIVAPMTRVFPRWSPNNWIAGIGSSFAGLDTYRKWRDMGIAYADNLSGNWWGVINRDNNEGILRIADNLTATKGMKLWTWGYSNGNRIDPEKDSSNGARPYIELWAGVTREFFNKTTMPALTEKAWTETYIPTIGLCDIADANENGAVSMETADLGTSVKFTAGFFSTTPGKPLTISLSLDGEKSFPLGTQDFVSSADGAETISVIRTKADFPAGTYELKARVNAADLTELISVSKPVSF